MEQVRFGIVGCGNMGSGHAKYFRDGKIKDGILTAVCDINPTKFKFFKDNFGDTIQYFEDAEQMFKSGLCDVVMICTPHYIHPDLAILAMDCNLHCIVEKPAGVYTLQVKKMLERHKKSDKILGIMFNQRTNPAFIKMRELVMSGEVGQIKRTNWIITTWYRTQFYYDSGSWRATWAGEGGGVLYNQAPHQLDQFQWITGMMPSKVRAFCHFGKWHNIEVEDDVTCYCEYPNGATGVFVTTTADLPGTNRFEITGTKATLIYEDKTLTIKRLPVDERETCFNASGGKGFVKSEHTTEVIKFENDGPKHVGIINNVIDAVLGRAELYAPAEDGINGVELANAMHLSTWLDKPVSLPIDAELYYSELQKRVAISKPRENVVETVVPQG